MLLYPQTRPGVPCMPLTRGSSPHLTDEESEARRAEETRLRTRTHTAFVTEAQNTYGADRRVYKPYTCSWINFHTCDRHLQQDTEQPPLRGGGLSCSSPSAPTHPLLRGPLFQPPPSTLVLPVLDLHIRGIIRGGLSCLAAPTQCRGRSLVLLPVSDGCSSPQV